MRQENVAPQHMVAIWLLPLASISSWQSSGQSSQSAKPRNLLPRTSTVCMPGISPTHLCGWVGGWVRNDVIGKYGGVWMHAHHHTKPTRVQASPQEQTHATHAHAHTHIHARKHTHAYTQTAQRSATEARQM
jgi:hypothetical protein